MDRDGVDYGPAFTALAASRRQKNSQFSYI
nr:MAG TPA: hypothetical protein [Caudoviricetes sp.]